MWKSGCEGEQSEEIEAQCNQYEHDAGCDKGGIPKIEESTAMCETNLENLPSSMEEVTTIPELEQHGVPNGRVFIRKKLKGKFPIKGRMKNKKKAIRRFIGVLTPPFDVSKPYNETNDKGETHRRIDVIKDIKGKLGSYPFKLAVITQEESPHILMILASQENEEKQKTQSQSGKGNRLR